VLVLSDSNFGGDILQMVGTTFPTFEETFQLQTEWHRRRTTRFA
jgi:hypothetical protein